MKAMVRRRRTESPVSARGAHGDQLQDNGAFDDDQYSEDVGSAVGQKIFDVILSIVQACALSVGIAWMILLVAMNASYEFIRWSFTPRGLLSICPLLIVASVCGVWAAMEKDYGVESLFYKLLLEEAGNLDRIFAKVNLSSDLPIDKTLGYGLIARRSALDLAADRGFLAAARALLDIGKHPDVGWTFGPWRSFGCGAPLVEAARSGRGETLQALISARASVDLGWQHGPYGLLGSSTPLASAATRGHVTAIRLLVDANAAVDQGWSLGSAGILASATPLRAAAWFNHTTAVKLLLDARAMPDAGASVGPLGMIWSDTPLLCAVSNGNLLALRALLKAGASPSSATGEELRKASFQGHVPIVTTLLEARALPDQHGRAVQSAARGGHDEIVQLLMAATRRVRQAAANVSIA